MLKLSVVSGAAGAAGQRAGSREPTVCVEVVCGVRSCWGGQCVLKLSVVSGAAGAAGQGSREPRESVVSGAAGAAGQRAGGREPSVRVEVVSGVRSCWGGWAESRQ